MKSFFRKTVLFCGAVFCSAVCASKEPEESIYRFFNDMLIFECTGIERSSGIAQKSGVSEIPSVLFTCTKWNDGCQVGNLFDYYVPDCAGLLSAFVAYNAVEDDALWAENLFFSEENAFVLDRPAELDEAAQELDRMREAEIGGAEGELADESEELLQLVENNVRNDAQKKKENSGAGEEEPVVERRLRNAQQMLSLYSYGAEVFTVKNSGEGGSVIVSSFQKKMTRQYYDGKMRLVKKEYWDLSGGISGSRKTKTELFEYGEGVFPVSAQILEESARHLLSYDANGRVCVSRNYRAVETPADSGKSVSGEKTADGGGTNLEKRRQFVLVSRTEWKYTQDGSVSEKYYVEYTYKDASSSMITAKNSKREVFEYKIEGGLPDYYYYENSVLRMQTVYSGENSYMSASYFDGGFVVESYYNEGNHTKDLFYMNGTLWRSRVYE